MIAFTRIDTRPILERGLVVSPDVVAIADASLLDDPLVRPLQGMSGNGVILINSPGKAPTAQAAAIALDFTGLALSHTGSTAAVGVALGAGAAKLAGLDVHFVEEAVREEIEQLKLDAARVDKNVALARACFDAVSRSFSLRKSRQGECSYAMSSSCVITPGYEGAWWGTASVASRPNTPARKTGDWRVRRPVIDLERCTHCWICFATCPDGAIALGAGDTPQIDYGVCKGCLICAEECPIDAISAPRETRVEGGA